MTKEEMKPRSAILREALEKSKRDDRAGKAEKVMFSVPEACAQLGISRWTLYEQFHNGKLKSVRIGNRRLISMRSIEKFIDQLETEEG